MLKPVATVAFCALSMTLTQTSFAQLIPADEEIEERRAIELTVGGGSSDNIFQQTRNEESGSYSALGMSFDVLQESRRVLFQVDGAVEHRNYSESQIDDELYGSLIADIEIQAVPDRFSWIFRDTFGQGRLDPFLSFTPTNREQINIFSTGPSFTLPAGERTEIRLSALVGERSYDKSVGFDGDITQSEIGLFRALSTTADFGIAVSSREVEYDDIALENDINRVFLAYDKRLASGQATVAVGSNEVDFGTSKDSQPFFDISWLRDVGTRSRVNVSVEGQFVDSSDTFRGGSDFDDTLRSVDVYERTSVGLSYLITGTRSRITIGGRVGQDRYENEIDLNNDLTSFSIDYTRILSDRADLGFRVFFAERDFVVSDQTADDKTFSAYFDRSLGRRASLLGEYRLTSRDGRAAGQYTENILIVTLSFALNTES